jgi:two-component system cell cycle sensor histidine kinase/response regulator CckA
MHGWPFTSFFWCAGLFHEGRLSRLTFYLRAATPPPWMLERYDARTCKVAAAVAFAYFCAAKFGLVVAFTHSGVTAVWPSTGVAIATLVLFGHRIWPAILIAAFAANVTHGLPVPASAGICLGNTAGPLAAAWLLGRSGFDPKLARVRDALALMVSGALGMILTATCGVASLALTAMIPWQDSFRVWWPWWTGDTAGVLVMAPLILSWAGKGGKWRIDPRLFEFALLCVGLVVLALVVLDDPSAAQYKYVLFLGVVWVAMRFGLRGTSTLVVLMVGLAVWGAEHGHEVFVARNFEARLIELQLFMGAIAVTGLVLATVVRERERARASLQQTHDELAAAESRLRTVITNAPLAIWSTDMDGRFTFVAGAVLAKMGMSSEQLIGSHYGEITDNERIHRAMRAALEGEACQFIVNYAGLILETHMEPLSAEADRSAGVIGVSIDVTERVQAELEKQRLAERMQHSQKLESLGVLAGGIAHDFNNLLTAIIGNTDLALMHGADAVLRQHLGQIQLAASRAADLTRQMLAYAGKRPFKLVETNLSKTVEEMACLLGASISKKASLSYRFPPDLPPIDADPAQLSQVVMNLITNASDALGGAHGSIVVSTGIVDVDAQTLASCVFDEGLAPGRFVYFEVSDTGAGMDPATIVRMFDPFFTTKFAGRGLGLSAVRGIMRGHKGTLSVSSQPGHGTTMRALFPVGGSAAKPDREPAFDPSWRSQGTILVVDDEQSVREVGRRMLEGLGFSVIWAADGEGAVAAYRRARESIRAVLLDMTMPVMNGEETFIALERINPEVKVVLCSGYTQEDAMERFAGRGLAGFLQKPFVARDLVSLLRRVLGE